MKALMQLSTTTSTTVTMSTTMSITMNTTNPKIMTMSGSTCLTSLRTQRSKNQSWPVCWRVSRRAERDRARVSGKARKAVARVSPVMFRKLERVVVLKTTNKFDGNCRAIDLTEAGKISQLM